MNDRKELRPKFAAIQDRLGTASGPRYWRALEELADSAAFAELVRSEFPEQADVWPESLSRRRFLRLMGASLALAGLGGCSVRPAPSVDLVPYAHPPEPVVPGRPLFFATTMTHAGSGVGLLVESHTGRPTKIEGNPDHPSSRGATNAYHQASVLQLYDPDRSTTVSYLGQTRTWSEFVAALKGPLAKLRKRRGSGLRLLTETIISPTLAWQLNALLHDLPEARWHVWEPIHRDSARKAQEIAFGRPLDTIYHFTKADRVLSLDSDFLQCANGHLSYDAEFISRRRVRTTEKDAASATMNRLYVAETAVTCTGAKADHRLALRPSEIETLARAIAARCGIDAVGSATAPGNETWVAAVAKDLQEHRGSSLVLAGDCQPAAVHLLAYALNEKLGNVGATLGYIAPTDARPVQRTQSLRELIADIDKKQVEILVVLSGNPVYSAPADLDFAAHMAAVPLCVRHGLYIDETSYHCQWQLPEAHYLEAWSDSRAHDGTASLVQPLIEPLYEGRSAHEVLNILATGQERPGREIVREYWRQQLDKGDFERFWRTALHRGAVPDTAFKEETLTMRQGWEESVRSHGAPRPNKPLPLASEGGGSLDLVFHPDPMLHDGQFANNGWLQELPKPLTKLTWGNAAIMSPATARRLGVTAGDYAHGGEHGGYYMPVVQLTVDGRSVSAPAWIMPGHADDTVVVYLGNGRENAGRVGGHAGERVGFNAGLLRTADRPWSAAGLVVELQRGSELVACTQAHQTMEDRAPVRAATLEEYRRHPNFATEEDRQKLSDQGQTQADAVTLYPQYDYGPPKHKWGMSIDLTACIGCHACVVACQAENNIAVVGKDQVARGREMHWLRIDRYISGTPDNPDEFHFQPVPCMQCENAPCEYVCPVAATVHSSEGLNDMNYQRCVGTRFCSNNCPYKVRRFNFLKFSDFETPTRRLQYNPEVTVRSRGVMEKCTYCVQRIRRAEIDAQNERRPIADGEVLTACQAACPTQAIVFGDINDERSHDGRGSEVRNCKESPLQYALLGDTNTRPRTTYLAALRNPNKELEGS
jgi:molybdopterin-containing oxidoreductase family iron-sulfur binding subunit